MMKTMMIGSFIAMLLLSGCSDKTSDANPTDEQQVIPVDEANTTVAEPTLYTSSAGVYLAESNETDRNGYLFYTHPIYIDSKLYTRQYRNIASSSGVGMQVIAYDLASFNSDLNLSTLPASTLYVQEGPGYTTARFNQRYYDIAEVDGALYFSTLPENTATLSQSSYIKFTLAADSEVYHQQGTPWMGEYLDTTFDLARGWFLPFGSDNYMGVVEDGVVKAFETDTGDFYKTDVYDYFGRGYTAGAYTDGRPPVGNNDHFFFADQKLVNATFSSSVVDYGARDFTHDPDYKVNDILGDVNAIYSGPKVYTQANYNGAGTGAISPLVLDGDNLYCIALLAYDDSDGYTKHDMYLLEYDGTSVLQQMHLFGEESTVGNFIDITQVYKYKENLYFKFRYDGKAEFCSYGLTTHAYNYRILIGDHPRLPDLPWTAYAITGDHVIIPQKIKTAEYDAENSTESTFYYHLVFKVYDLADGTLVETLRHKDLMGLYSSLDDTDIYDAYSDGESVYFTGEKRSNTFNRNIIVKISSPGNKVYLSRFRGDAHLSGVLTDH